MNQRYSSRVTNAIDHNSIGAARYDSLAATFKTAVRAQTRSCLALRAYLFALACMFVTTSACCKSGGYKTCMPRAVDATQQDRRGQR